MPSTVLDVFRIIHLQDRCYFLSVLGGEGEGGN